MFQVLFLQESAGGLASMLPIFAMIIVLYFFMIRPQRNKMKKEKSFLAEIKKGSKVVMSNGIHGKITEFHTADNTVTIETGAGKIKFERSAISMEMSKKHSTPPAKK